MKVIDGKFGSKEKPEVSIKDFIQRFADTVDTEGSVAVALIAWDMDTGQISSGFSHDWMVSNAVLDLAKQYVILGE